MNKFNNAQSNVIAELAGFYWDNNQRGWYPPGMSEGSIDSIRNRYIEDITKGLEDEMVWGLDKPVFEPLG